ncbi:MAG TPA: 1,4-alpha-glucan branching protein GlgB [Tepidisphaeraceae bacterium]|nr:1,4-alpha-glucan branching protein GlgB [Tepidisphaeraceae bacterium]
MSRTIDHPQTNAASATARASTAAAAAAAAGQQPASLLGDHDLYLFNEGTHSRLYDKLGAHVLPAGGVHFAVWAPNAQYISVVGDFNDWDKGRHPLRARGSSGIWEGIIPEARDGSHYKFHVASRHMGYTVDKVDPFGFMHGTPPRQESIVRKLDYTWADADWMASRAQRQKLDQPMSIYEMHLGSWMRVPEEENRSLTYREMAPRLVEYLTHRGFTHVEFLPMMEHPFYGSWGYQTTGYFAPTSRFGTPQDLMFLIDQLHQAGIGVLLDWVPSHFPEDEHGLKYFDGTHLYEHADPRKGFHPDWKSAIFNYGRNEVRAFLLSSAIFWMDKYHADGLRVDAVASMLYLDYGRKDGEWIPNEYGGKENIEAINFLRQLNSEVYGQFPGTTTIAEESTSWPMVSRPAHIGGLGFGYKWDMGWMNDTLRYFKDDPVHRKYHQNLLTFRSMYQYAENYVLPLSHDEVVHLKGSLLGRMPGDTWQRFANLRLLLVNQWVQPGKKLLFMGGEFGQWAEWNHDSSLDWNLLWWESHKGVQQLVDDLNRLYRNEPAMHEGDCEPFGFEWVDANDSEQSVTTFLRRGRRKDDVLMVAMNHTPVPRYNYRVGVPVGGTWREVLNSDAKVYWGSGQGNLGDIGASPLPYHAWPRSLTLTLPPMGAIIMKPTGEPAPE